MTVNIAPETETRLRETAQREGQDVDSFTDTLLADALEERARQLAEDAAAVQEALRAVQGGRERPFAQFMAEHQARYTKAAIPAGSIVTLPPEMYSSVTRLPCRSFAPKSGLPSAA